MCLLFEYRHLGRELWIERLRVGTREVTQGLLQRLGVRGSQELVASLQCLQSPAERALVTRQRVAMFVAELVLGQDRIPDKTRAAEELPQQSVLGSARLQAEAISLASDHLFMVALVCGRCNRLPNWQALRLCPPRSFGLCDQISPPCLHGQASRRDADPLYGPVRGFRVDAHRVRRGGRSRSSARQISAQSRALGIGQQSQGSFIPVAPQISPRARASLLEGRSLVAKLFRCVLWRRSTIDHQALHREPTHASLRMPKARALYPRPERRGFTALRVSKA